MAPPSVTASLIVRNEAERLPACLKSLAHLVDEVLIVDTGSVDATVEIAESFGARVLRFQWIDDFSAARNFGLEQCRTDWVFYIDADEELVAPSRGPVGTYLRRDWIGANVHLRPKPNYTRYKLARLFRADPRLRFHGAIHETILPSLEALEAEGVGLIGTTPLKIDHSGYEGEQARKHHRNLPLLLKCVKLYPARVYYWFHLTETLLALGRYEEAENAGQEGLAAAERGLSEKGRVDGSLICQMLAAAMLKRDTDPLALLQRGLALHPGNHGLELTLAQRHLAVGECEAAARITAALRKINPDRLQSELIAYDRAIFGKYAAQIEVACLMRLGRLAEASRLLI
jgi:tetratricopeptide (TPR) repeat protein